MLYKPKFMSPDLNMDVKWAYYDEIGEEEDIKPIIFSCVCDGNSGVKELKLELVWSNSLEEIENGKTIINTYFFKKEFSQDFSIYDDKNVVIGYHYPVDYNNQYNEFVINKQPDDIKYDTFKKNNHVWKDEETSTNEKNVLPSFTEEQLKKFTSPRDKKITAKYTLISESGQEVYNYSTFYFKSKPDLNIEIVQDFETDNSQLSSSKGEFQIQDFNKKNIIVEYYYWEIYSQITLEDSSIEYIKLFQSNKIYSQDIKFIYSNFINLQNYLIKCHIITNLSEHFVSELSFNTNYAIAQISSSLSNIKYLDKETGVLIALALNINSSQVYDSNEEDISSAVNNGEKIIRDEIFNSGKTINSDLLDLTSNSKLKMLNLNSSDSWVYWSGYIHPTFNSLESDEDFLKILWIDNNKINHTTKIIKTSDFHLRIKDNNNFIEDILIKNDNDEEFQFKQGICWWNIMQMQLPEDGNFNNFKIRIIEYWKSNATYPSDRLYPSANTVPNSGYWIADADDSQKKEGGYQYGITND